MDMMLPDSIQIGEVVLRDGFQHEEKFIPTETKIYLANQFFEAGFKFIEVSSFSHPKVIPQFRDCEDVLKGIQRNPDVEHTCLTANMKAVERAIVAKRDGFGPDRILVMISTSEAHNKANTGRSTREQFHFIGEAVRLAHEHGIKVNGTVSTIWGCPFSGRMPISKALDFGNRLLDLGVDDVEHADHDGQATPSEVYEYFGAVLERNSDPQAHIFHVHDVRGFGLANYVTAIQAGIRRFETSLGGIGGQPANIVDGVPVRGTGEYYVSAGRTGLVCTEDFLVMLEAMGIETGLDVDKVLKLGRLLERILERKLNSLCLEAGRLHNGKLNGPQ